MGQDDDSFHIRPGKGRRRGTGRSLTPRLVRSRPKTFLGEVHQAIGRAGGDPNRLAGREGGNGRFNARGRGAKVAATLKGRNGWSRSVNGARTRSRRVAVKARVVKLNPQRGAARGRALVSAKAVDAHLRYLQRDGVTRDGDKGQVYSADKDIADGQAFLDRGRDDRHQFRFIVSAEDGVELSDLRQTTRDLMEAMEADLGTRLDWIAVDHHNTGHPHTHILVRGVTDDGKALNIAGDYIAHGVRERASEIVTLELGRQTEQDISRQLEREVEAQRFTRLDRMLIAEQDQGEFSDLRPDKDMMETSRRNRALLIERARKLERMGLAREHTPGLWTISPNAEPVLRELGTRGDIIKTLHQALDRAGVTGSRAFESYLIHQTTPSEPIICRVLGKALGPDELSDRVGLIDDGVDGRVHYIEAPISKVEGLQRGAIVVVEPPPSAPRTADLNILEAANQEGVYSPSVHREQGLARLAPNDADAFVRSHVRRLEALRRAGIVERVQAEHWTVPADLPARGLAHDRHQFGQGPRIDEASHLPLDRQIHHEGATWLDRTMVGGGRETLAHGGFGGDVRAAWEERKRALAEMGYVQDLGEGRFRAPKDLIAKLEQAEIGRVSQEIAAERGLTSTQSAPGQYVSGALTGTITLASGRFAMLETLSGDGGLGFQLVPWKPVLEKQIGKHVSGVMRDDGGIDWALGRQGGLGL